MLSQCANSQCSKPFLRLGRGKLFLLETKSSAAAPDTRALRKLRQESLRQRYWLCEDCEQSWTLIQDCGHGIALVPLTIPRMES